MSRRTRRSLLAAAGTALTGALAGCSDLFSAETTVEYDESELAALPGEIPEVPSAVPVQPTDEHLTSARARIRSLLNDADVSRVPNGVVRHKLARERESARAALSEDDQEEPRIDALVGLAHPRSTAMFVDAGLAAFDDALTADEVVTRRERYHREAESFLDDYSYAGPASDPIAAFAEHARITDWGHTGVRLTEPKRYHEYENTVLHVAELAQHVEWGRAYAADARRLHEHYVSTLDDTRDYEDHFASVAATLVDDVESDATRPDRESLTSDVERDIADTPAEKLLDELARPRWIGAQNAVENHDVGAVVPAMRSLTADRALSDAKNAVSEGAYGDPESVDQIAAERAAAVDGLRTVLDSSPALLARRLAYYVRNPLRDADRAADRNAGSAAGSDIYAHYAIANHFAAAAPAVIQRVGEMLEN